MITNSFTGIVRADKRIVKLELEVAKDKGRDYEELAKREKLKPLEVELKKMEDLITQIKVPFKSSFYHPKGIFRKTSTLSNPEKPSTETLVVSYFYSFLIQLI